MAITSKLCQREIATSLIKIYKRIFYCLNSDDDILKVIIVILFFAKLRNSFVKVDPVSKKIMKANHSRL